MKATIFKAFSNKRELAQFVPGKTLAQNFPDIDFRHAIAVVNGKPANESLVLKESDIVMVRQLPATTVAGAIFLIAVAVAGGAALGVSIYNMNARLERVKKEMEKMKEGLNSDIDNRPFLRGASNTIAKNKSQPYIMGRHLFTPYLLSQQFYRLYGKDGIDEYTYLVLECGFNKQVLRKIAVEDIVVKTFSDDTPQQGAFPLDADQVFVEDGLVEISQNGSLFTALPELNYKIVSTVKNTEIPRDCKIKKGEAEPLTFSLDKYAMNVDIAISFPYGLYYMEDDGDKKETEITITPQYSLDGGNEWIDFVFDNNGQATNVFYRREDKKELRFRAHKDFSLADYETLFANGQECILLRVRSNGNQDTAIKNDCYCLYYQSVCFDPNKSSTPAGIVRDDGGAGLVPCLVMEDREREFCTLLALRVKATKNNEDKLQKVNIITQGIAREWFNGGWLQDKRPTRNPAAWALEVLTSDSHPLSKFSDDEIDLESFGEFYEYCERNGFMFDHVVAQNAKKMATLELILSATGATLYRDMYGRIAVAVDKRQENAIAVYNPQNIISISNKKTFGRRTDGLRIKFITSENDLYTEDTYLLMREVEGVPLEMNADSVIKDVSVTGITTSAHIAKYARRLMAIEALRPKTTTIEVGNEGVYFTPYSKILLQDDSLKIGTGNGVVKQTFWEDGLLSKILIDGKVVFEEGKSYGVIVNCYGRDKPSPLALKVSGQGRTDLLLVETACVENSSVIPEPGNVLSFGELGEGGDFAKITTPYLINGISRTEKGFRLELSDYNEAVYDSGTIPEYRSNITAKPVSLNSEVPPDYVKRGELQSVLNSVNAVLEAPAFVSAVASKDGIELYCNPSEGMRRNDIGSVRWIVRKANGNVADFTKSGTSATYMFDREVDGYPEAEDLRNWSVCAAVNSVYGGASPFSESFYVDVSKYGTWIVSPALCSTRVSDRTITLLLGMSPRSDGRQLYGNVSYRIQIKRFDDSEWHKPNKGGTAYPDHNGSNEFNYKDGYGFVESDSVYIQTMPLRGQGGEEGLFDTQYGFRIVATNGVSQSEPLDVFETALCTSIRDIVKANETVKEAYISSLSAISANFGTIKSGGLNNGQNYWDLSSYWDEDLKQQRFKGAFRVGGAEQYLLVTPKVRAGEIEPYGYEIEFKVGTFSLTSEASNINGELVVQERGDSLDRIRITPNGVYMEHRENALSSEWKGIAKQDVNGIESSQLFSEKTLVVSNQSAARRRAERTDIGLPYLSDNSVVYHFDTDTMDQYGRGRNFLDVVSPVGVFYESPVSIEISGVFSLKGVESNGENGIDFTPAILSVAPYSPTAKSLCGNFSIASVFSADNFTIDFWIKYIFSENQTLFDIGNAQNRIRLCVQATEAYYNDLECPETVEEEDDFLYNNESGAAPSGLFSRYAVRSDVYFGEGYAGEKTAFEARYESIAEEPFNPEFVYWRKDSSGSFLCAHVDAFCYDDMVVEGLYMYQREYNKPDSATGYIEYITNLGRQTIMLPDIGAFLKEGVWVHIGIVQDASRFRVFFNDKKMDFSRAAVGEREVEITLNSSRSSFILDELMIDPTAAESFERFAANTTLRIPWGALDCDEQWTVLTVKDPERLVTNIFESAAFREKAAELLAEEGFYERVREIHESLQGGQ